MNDRGLPAFLIALAMICLPVLAQADSQSYLMSDDGKKFAAPSTEVAEQEKPPFVRAEVEESLDLYMEGVYDAGEFVEFNPIPHSDLLLYGKEQAIEAILSWDTRVRTYTIEYPASAVVYMTRDEKRWCTGTLIGKRTVATAGHCVHKGGGGDDNWYDRTKFKIYPGADGNTKPYGSCNAVQLWSVAGWIQNNDEEYDYGAIILDCTVGNQTGTFGFTTEDPTNKPSILTGYPEDKSVATQWQSSDKVATTSSRQIFYLNDTIGGMSGSPVWYDKEGPYMIGIHAKPPHGTGNHNKYNHGVRITGPVFDNLNYLSEL